MLASDSSMSEVALAARDGIGSDAVSLLDVSRLSGVSPGAACRLDFLAALERVLSQRTEILCMLHPVSPRMAAAWGAVPHGQPQRSGGGSTAADGTVAAPLPGTLAAQVS